MRRVAKLLVGNQYRDDELSDFYPTPQTISHKMLFGLDFDTIESVLEPSAGNDFSENLTFMYK